MLRAISRPFERCCGGLRIGTSGGGGGDGLIWQTELKPHASGDYSIAVVQANSSLEDQGQVFASPSATYVGVYDGHGGPEASRFVTKNLFPYLHKFATEQGGMSADVIKKTFSATEEEFLRLVKTSWQVKPGMASVGSCCLMGAIMNDTLYVANLGDSRAVLGRKMNGSRSRVVAERLSTDHNVSDEEVRREVEANHPDDSHVVVYTHGVWRIKGIIQVSRSIGDVYLKKPEFSRDPLYQHFVTPVPMKRPVVTAEPSILTRNIKPQDMFLIFASDGLWEQLSDETTVELVFKNPRAGIAKTLVRAALHEAAKKREMRYGDIKKIEKGIRRHFHDDITVIVVYLDQHKSSSKRKRATRIVDQKSVERIYGQPSGRSIFQVVGESRRKEEYFCFAQHYCAYYSFFYAVNRGEQLCCKHQLAARLAAALGACIDEIVSDEQLAVILSKL